MISIIIPVFNNWSLTEQCLSSLAATTPAGAVEVIVVDNGSGDETASACQPLGASLFGESFQLLRSEMNLNFAAGCNWGAREASGEMLFFLNNDTIALPGWLDPLVDAFERIPNLGMAGPLLTYPAVGPYPDRVQHLGVVCEPQLYLAHLYEFFPASHPLVRKVRAWQALTAAALMVPRSLFEQAGGFHEQYVNGGEDVDLCCQVRGLGRQLVNVPESRFHHLASQTPGVHDHTAHNAEVLRSRCLDSLAPDLHRLGEQDGYDLALTAGLRPYLRLPPRRAALIGRRLTGLADAKDRDGLLALMDSEPLLEAAYPLVAGLQAEAGEWDAAVHTMFLRARLVPTGEAYADLARAVDQARVQVSNQDSASVAVYDSFIESGLTAAKDAAAKPEVLKEQAKALESFARRLGQTKLAETYAAWG